MREEDVLLTMETAELLLWSHEEDFMLDEAHESPIAMQYDAALSLIEKARASGGTLIDASFR